MIFRRALLLTIMLLALAGLSACTRERTPWPTSTPTYGVEAMTTPMPIDASAGTILPRYTPHVLNPSFATETPTAAPVPATLPSATPPPPVMTPASAPLQTGPTPTATLPPGYRRYTVQPGETLYDIAVKFNVSLENLARVNKITDPTTIKANQKLIIPPR
jgi:LysM repeat protein